MIKWLIIIPLVIATIIGGISLYLQPNDFIGCSEQPVEGLGHCAKADAVVVVSGGDTVARTAEGIKLVKNGWADSLVLSGAAQDKTGLSNAAAMRMQALASGVPDSAIFIEETSENTEQNAANTHTIFSLNNFKDVILVTSGYHQRRANLEFEKRSEGIEILNHPLLDDKDWSAFWWVTPRGWWLAGGETVKVLAFYLQGARS